MKQHIDKLNRLSESHGPLQPGKGMASGVIALCLAALCFLGVLAFHFPEYLTTPQLRKSYNVDAMRLLLFWSLVLSGAHGALQHRHEPRTLARPRGVRADRPVARARRPQGAGQRLRRQHALHRPRLVHPRPARLDADLRLHREAVRAAQGPAGVSRRVADRLPPLPGQPHDRGLRPARDQPARPQAVRLGRQGRHPRVGAGPALLRRAVPDRPGRRPGAVLDAPCLPRGAGALAPARRPPQRQEHGLARRLAPAHPRADHDANARPRADLRARLQQGSDRRLHRDRRLPGGVQPRQRERAARAVAPRHRHAQLPPLAPLAGRRRDRQELRRALRLPRPPVRHRAQGRPSLAERSTAWSATTCRTASSSSSRSRSAGRAEAARGRAVRRRNRRRRRRGAALRRPSPASSAVRSSCSTTPRRSPRRSASPAAGAATSPTATPARPTSSPRTRDFCRSALARYTPQRLHRARRAPRHRAGTRSTRASSSATTRARQIIAMLLAECDAGGVQRWQPCRVRRRAPRPARLRARHRARRRARVAPGRRHRRALDPEDRRQRLRLPRSPGSSATGSSSRARRWCR